MRFWFRIEKKQVERIMMEKKLQEKKELEKKLPEKKEVKRIIIFSEYF